MWERKVASGKRGTFGSVAVYFHKNLSISSIDVPLPGHLEMVFFRVWTQHQSSILLCVCYRPQWQGSDPINFLQAYLDELLQQYYCDYVVIAGDMKQHLVARSLEELLTGFGLRNHVFSAHISGSSLDPVISNLPETLLTRRPLSAWTQQTTLPS